VPIAAVAGAGGSLAVGSAIFLPLGRLQHRPMTPVPVREWANGSAQPNPVKPVASA